MALAAAKRANVSVVFQLLYDLYGYDCECVGQGDSNYSN